MEEKARIISINRDWKSGKFQIAFEMDRRPEEIQGDVRLIYKKWRNRRSLDANAYMWVLLQDMALQLDSTAEEIYEDMLQRYGLLDRDESGYIPITMRADIDSSHLPGHWKLDRIRSTIAWKVYFRIRGTSEYDTKEMSWFLDRVIEEAKSIGVETMTPDEIERLKGYEKQRTG